MSKEEQEAIRLLNLCINSNTPLPEEALSLVKTLFNLIDKLQKENEELKELAKEQMLFTFKNNTLDSIELVKNDFISKDKIRNKIKNIEENIDNLNNSSAFEEQQCQQRLEDLFNEREILQELLEEK